MKKLSLILAVVMIMSVMLCSCGNNLKTVIQRYKTTQGPTDDGITSLYEEEDTTDKNKNIIRNPYVEYFYYDDYYNLRDTDYNEVEKYYESIKKSNENDQYFVTDYNGGICVNQYVGDDENLVLPDTLDNKRIIKIGIVPNIYEVYNLGGFGVGNGKSVTISKYVKEICNDTLFWCGFENGKFTLENIFVNKDNPYYTSVDGILYNKDKTVLLAIPNNYQQKEITIPKSVEHITATLEFEQEFTINGYMGTTAETFAKENNLKFVALD